MPNRPSLSEKELALIAAARKEAAARAPAQAAPSSSPAPAGKVPPAAAKPATAPRAAPALSMEERIAALMLKEQQKKAQRRRALYRWKIGTAAVFTALLLWGVLTMFRHGVH